jgi:hypothetical protein
LAFPERLALSSGQVLTFGTNRIAGNDGAFTASGLAEP